VKDKSLLATAFILATSEDSPLDPDGPSAGGVLSKFSSLCHAILCRSLSLTLQAAPRLWATSPGKQSCPPLPHRATAQGDSRLVSHPRDYVSCATKRDGCERCLQAFVWIRSHTALLAFVFLGPH